METMEKEISRFATATQYVEAADLFQACENTGESDLVAAAVLLADYRVNDGKRYGSDK